MGGPNVRQLRLFSIKEALKQLITEKLSDEKRHGGEV
jgi:hypothetical protein